MDGLKLMDILMDIEVVILGVIFCDVFVIL